MVHGDEDAASTRNTRAHVELRPTDPSKNRKHQGAENHVVATKCVLPSFREEMDERIHEEASPDVARDEDEPNEHKRCCSNQLSNQYHNVL